MLQLAIRDAEVIGATVEEYLKRETVYGIKLKLAARKIEDEQEREVELVREVSEDLEANKGRFTNGL